MARVSVRVGVLVNGLGLGLGLVLVSRLPWVRVSVRVLRARQLGAKSASNMLVLGLGQG